MAAPSRSGAQKDARRETDQAMFQRAKDPDIFSASIIQHSVCLTMAASSTEVEAPSYIVIPSEIARALPIRRMQFIAGRYCAYQAMRRLEPSRTPRPVLRSPDGRPLWAEGLVGSITHTDSFATCAVALSREVAAIGVDSERVMTAELANEVCSLIATEREISEIMKCGLGRAESVSLIFSAKEAIFKGLNPLTGKYFDYLDCELLAVDERARDFTARLVNDLNEKFQAGTLLNGRFEIDAGHVHTGIALAEPPPKR